MEPLLPSTSNLEDHGTTDAVAVATSRHYGATVRDDGSVDSSHIRATSRRNRRSSLPAAFTPSSPELRTRRLRMAIMGGVAVLLVVAILALVSAHQAPVYDDALTSASAVFPWALAASPPSQIHVSLADDTATVGKRVGMTISWATDKKTTNSSVRYGQTRDAMSATAFADAPCEQYEFCLYTSAWFHHVTISGDALLPDTTYYYQCGDESSGWSDVHSFKTVVTIGSETPLTFGVIGDLGQTKYSEETLRHLSSLRSMSAILHAGDLSYADSDQPRWDRWGKLVEPLSARMPWMVSAGNHEEERPCQAEVSKFVAYQVRFRMPYEQKNRLQRRNLYYGFRVGLAHFIILTPYVDSSPTSLQYQWLEEELVRVDRSVTPWVVVIMHGPWYNSNTAHQGSEPHMIMKKNMEDILYRYKVDLAIAGHVHAYERSYPVYKETVQNDGTVYVVLGDAGNREGLAPTYIDPQPAWSAFRQADYGYALLNVLNRTHASVDWFEDQAQGDAILHDSVMLTTTRFRTT